MMMQRLLSTASSCRSRAQGSARRAPSEPKRPRLTASSSRLRWRSSSSSATRTRDRRAPHRAPSAEQSHTPTAREVSRANRALSLRHRSPLVLLQQSMGVDVSLRRLSCAGARTPAPASRATPRLGTAGCHVSLVRAWWWSGVGGTCSERRGRATGNATQRKHAAAATQREGAHLLNFLIFNLLITNSYEAALHNQAFWP